MASVNLPLPVLSREFASMLLEAITPASVEPHLIVGPKLALLGTNTLSLTPGLVKADLDAEEAAFSGYAAGGKAVVLTAPGVVRQSDRIQLLGGNAVWVVETASPLVTAVVYGAYLYDTTYGVIACGYFTVPVLLGVVGDYLDLFAGVPVILRS